MTLDKVRCASCGKQTPDENLRCIFCGELLQATSGTLGRLRYGGAARWLLVGVSLLLVFWLASRFL